MCGDLLKTLSALRDYRTNQEMNGAYSVVLNLALCEPCVR